MSDDVNSLVQQAADGSKSALKMLLVRTRKDLQARIARRIPTSLAGKVDPDDIVQETQIEVFRRIGSFNQTAPDAFNRWLATIALSRLRNQIKHHQTQKRGGGRMDARLDVNPAFEASMVALLDSLAGAGRTPSQSVARTEAIDAVRGALTRIPEHYQQAVWLVHIEGLPVREVASRMDKTERAIHGLCRRGLDSLRAELDHGCHFFNSKG